MSKSPKKLMTKKAASRIQSDQAKQNGGKVEEKTFPSRVQSAADRNENK